MTDTVAAPPVPPYQWVAQKPRTAPLWEQALVALWVLVTTVTFPRDELFLYPLAMFFLGSFFLRRTEIVPFALKNWILFLLPLWAMASYLWSPVPAHSLRFGTFMLLTVIIAIYVAKRLTVRQIVEAVFVANVVVILIVAPSMGSFDEGGPFGEKNIFAWRMTIALLSALALALDPKEPPIIRLVAMPVIPVAFLFMFMAKSATTLVMSLAAIFVFLIVWLFWTNVSRIRHLRVLLIVVFLMSIVVSTLLMAFLPENDFSNAFLGLIGKDSTLTGRTMLWHTGREVVREHPWLGYGAGGYWRLDVGTAQTLLELSFKPAGSSFSFHSSYLETQVNLGRIGLMTLIFTVAWSLYRTVLGWLKTQDVKHSFLMLVAMIMFITSFTESVFFSAFDISVTLFFIAAATSLKREEPEYVAVPTDAFPQSPEEAALLADRYGR
ncbi:MAG: O-antigen ligase family protein [Hyphomonadaceae bacterium]